MQKHAQVVVIGGGNMGAGVLYHLAHMGWTNCVLIEKSELTSGATWHAAGLVSRMVGGQALGSIHDYAVDLYKQIEAETRCRRQLARLRITACGHQSRAYGLDQPHSRRRTGAWARGAYH